MFHFKMFTYLYFVSQLSIDICDVSMSSTLYGTVSFCYSILTTILQNIFFFFSFFLEFQYVLLMEMQKLTRTQNKILEQLPLLAMDNTFITQNMDALQPVTTMQEFDI